MKYKIERTNRNEFTIHLTEEVANIMSRLSHGGEEEVEAMGPMGPLTLTRQYTEPRKDLIGVEYLTQMSRYSFLIVIGKAFEHKTVIGNLMSKLDCDIDMDDTEIDEQLKPVAEANPLVDKLMSLINEARSEEKD